MTLALDLCLPTVTRNLANDHRAEIIVSDDGEKCRYILWQGEDIIFTELTASPEYALKYAREKANARRPRRKPLEGRA